MTRRAAILLGAVLGGAIGFVAGFFGPIVLTPEANQGPLLGIFITGPAGDLLGGMLGALLGSPHATILRGPGGPDPTAETRRMRENAD